MKHIFSIILLSLMTVSVMAVQYPKKPYTGGGTMSHAPVTYQQQAGQKHGSLTPIGASTPSTYPTIGAGAPTPIAAGPRRTSWYGGEFNDGKGTPDDLNGTPEEGDWWLADDGKWYQWIGGEWLSETDDNPGNPAPDTPLGSTWVMLLFAALFASSVALRRRSQA